MAFTLHFTGCNVKSVYYPFLRAFLLFYEPIEFCLTGRDRSVCVATRYGLEDLGIESRWNEIFRTLPDLPWNLPSLLYNGYWVFPGGKAAGAWC